MVFCTKIQKNNYTDTKIRANSFSVCRNENKIFGICVKLYHFDNSKVSYAKNLSFPHAQKMAYKSRIINFFNAK